MSGLAAEALYFARLTRFWVWLRSTPCLSVAGFTCPGSAKSTSSTGIPSAAAALTSAGHCGSPLPMTPTPTTVGVGATASNGVKRPPAAAVGIFAPPTTLAPSATAVARALMEDGSAVPPLFINFVSLVIDIVLPTDRHRVATYARGTVPSLHGMPTGRSPLHPTGHSIHAT